MIKRPKRRRKIPTRTWAFGTTRRCRVVDRKQMGMAEVGIVLIVIDEKNEGHVILFHPDDEDPARKAQAGDEGTITFTMGGPNGGWWRFSKE